MIGQLAAAVIPGFDYECDPDSSSIWTDWVAPGCTETDTPAAQFIRDSMFEPFVNDMKQGVAESTKTLSTFWVSLPDPDIGNAQTGAASEVVGFLQSGLAPLVGFLMVVAVIIGGIKIMWDGRNSGKQFRTVMELLIRYVLTSALAVPVIASALLISRAVGEAILGQSTQGTSFADNLFALFNSDAGAVSGILLIVLLLIAALVAAIQVGIMIARGAALILLTGTVLVAVAMGEQVFRQYVGWFIAFITYPMAASIVYATGFRLMGTDTNAAGNSLLQVIYGIAIMVLAIFTLPAIIRLVIPLTAPVSSGRGAGGVLSGAAVTAVTMSAVRAA